MQIMGRFVVAFTCTLAACAAPDAPPEYGPPSALTAIDRDVGGFTNWRSHIALRGTQVTFETEFTGEEIVTHTQAIEVERVAMIIDALEAFDILMRAPSGGGCGIQPSDYAIVTLEVSLEAGSNTVSFGCETELHELWHSIDELAGFDAWVQAR